jgi:hypothetical protein
MEVPNPSFSKTQISFAKRIETSVPKNKGLKTQVPKRYLTLILKKEY